MTLKTQLLAGLVTLATTALLGLETRSASAAVISFGNNGLQFDTDTTVTFNFLGSNGGFMSALSVVDPTGVKATLFQEEAPGYDVPPFGDSAGTCGNAVLICQSTFTFLAGVSYSLLLESTSGVQVYSTNRLNPGNLRQAIFTSLPGQTQITFEDTPSRLDSDFNDFRIAANLEVTEVPEPAALVGLGLVAGVALLRRRERRQPS